MTPPCLIELECPKCRATRWTIDSDYRGIDGVLTHFDQEPHSCRRCPHRGPGWVIVQKSPPWFLLQPHELYPMTQEDFDYWAGILRTHFPEHPLLAALGREFRPLLPEEAEARRRERLAMRPIREMRDQDGARRQEPDLRVTHEWIDVMAPGGWLTLTRHDGRTLRLDRRGDLYAAQWLDEAGAVTAARDGLRLQDVRRVADRALTGRTTL